MTDRASLEFHRAVDAEKRGEGICRTCCQPIWFEVGKVGGDIRTEPDWSDRIERGGDSLVCFKAVHYRHEPLTGREAYIYDTAFERGHVAADTRQEVDDMAEDERTDRLEALCDRLAGKLVEQEDAIAALRAERDRLRSERSRPYGAPNDHPNVSLSSTGSWLPERNGDES
jgi:hypothetical protein